jgi:hypothetical protein
MSRSKQILKALHTDQSRTDSENTIEKVESSKDEVMSVDLNEKQIDNDDVINNDLVEKDFVAIETILCNFYSRRQPSEFSK